MNLSVVWEQVVRELSAGTLSPQQRAWMRVTRPIGLLDGTALLAAPSEFAKDAIERALRDPITDALSRRLGREVSLAVKVDPSAPPAPRTNGGATVDAGVGIGMEVPDAPPGAQLSLGTDTATAESDVDGEEVDEEGEALATVHEIWPTFSGSQTTTGQPFTAPAQPQTSKTRLNDKYKFDTFVIG